MKKYVIRLLGSDWYMSRPKNKYETRTNWSQFKKTNTLMFSRETEAMQVARGCGEPCEVVTVFGV
jgi:hypothetical protein